MKSAAFVDMGKAHTLLLHKLTIKQKPRSAHCLRALHDDAYCTSGRLRAPNALL